MFPLKSRVLGTVKVYHSSKALDTFLPSFWQAVKNFSISGLWDVRNDLFNSILKLFPILGPPFTNFSDSQLCRNHVEKILCNVYNQETLLKAPLVVIDKSTSSSAQRLAADACELAFVLKHGLGKSYGPQQCSVYCLILIYFMHSDSIHKTYILDEKSILLVLERTLKICIFLQK